MIVWAPVFGLAYQRKIFLWRKHGKLQAEQLLHPWRRRSGVRKQGAKPWLMCADQHEAPARVCWGTATSWMTVGGWAAIVPEYLMRYLWNAYLFAGGTATSSMTLGGGQQWWWIIGHWSPLRWYMAILDNYCRHVKLWWVNTVVLKKVVEPSMWNW